MLNQKLVAIVNEYRKVSRKFSVWRRVEASLVITMIAGLIVIAGETIIYQSDSRIVFSLKFFVPILVMSFIVSPFILARMKSQ